MAYISPWHIAAVPSVPLFFAVMADAAEHTQTHTIKGAAAAGGESSRALVVLDAPLSPWWSLHFHSAQAAFVSNQQKCLKVKGDSTPLHHHHHPTTSSTPPPALLPDEFKAAARIIYFLSFSSLYMVESARINAAYEVSRRGRRDGEREKAQSLQILYL